MLGHSHRRTWLDSEGASLPHIAVKESVFPFIKFPGVDMVLGPEMKSTGEVMGIDRDFRKAYLEVAAGRRTRRFPTSGKIFISVQEPRQAPRWCRLAQAARRTWASRWSPPPGTARVLERHGMSVGDRSTRSAKATGPT